MVRQDDEKIWRFAMLYPTQFSMQNPILMSKLWTLVVKHVCFYSFGFFVPLGSRPIFVSGCPWSSLAERTWLNIVFLALRSAKSFSQVPSPRAFQSPTKWGRRRRRRPPCFPLRALGDHTWLNDLAERSAKKPMLSQVRSAKLLVGTADCEIKSFASEEPEV